VQSVIVPIILHLQPARALLRPADSSMRQADDLPLHARLNLWDSVRLHGGQ
jgi:hypothetical protein